MDFTQPVEIANKIWWVGQYLPNDPFQCHPYFLENEDQSVLIDPGSMFEFETLIEKINTISHISKVKYIILHHQDPDLAAAVPAIESCIGRSDLRIVTHSRMVPLIKHYMICSDYYEIDKHQNQLQCGNLHLQFITTPYCHSPGAFVTYEAQTKTLFSGDIFGGIEESWEFYAKEDYFEKAKQFHAEYMPSRDIFNYALSRIEKLDIDLIAPQHGSLIQKPYIPQLIKQMKQLECGLYIDQHYKKELLQTIEALKEKERALKEKETFLLQKSKMADMGEMIGNIAHQWRQPLAINTAILSILKEKIKMQKIDPEEMLERFEEMESNIQYMSKTIDDFMRFYHPKKQKSIFSVTKVVEHVLRIIKPSLSKERIALHFSSCDESYVKGYMNEYTQVLIAILNNAKDVLLSRKIEHPSIHMELLRIANRIELRIRDNAGGIDESYIHRIFDPYFTTKHQSMGTGLGLYIAKMIIEKNMHGTLSVKNKDEGAQFTIVLEATDEYGTY